MVTQPEVLCFGMKPLKYVPKLSWVSDMCSDDNFEQPEGVHMLLQANKIQKMVKAPQLDSFSTGDAVLQQVSSEEWSEAIVGVSKAC